MHLFLHFPATQSDRNVVQVNAALTPLAPGAFSFLWVWWASRPTKDEQRSTKDFADSERTRLAENLRTQEVLLAEAMDEKLRLELALQKAQDEARRELQGDGRKLLKMFESGRWKACKSRCMNNPRGSTMVKTCSFQPPVRTALDLQRALEEGSAVEIKELCKNLEEKATDSWTLCYFVLPLTTTGY